MKTEILLLFFCFLNLWPAPEVEKTSKKMEVESAVAEPQIDMFSPLFLIEF